MQGLQGNRYVSPPLPAPWREHPSSVGVAERLPLPCRQWCQAHLPSCALASGGVLTLMPAAASKVTASQGNSCVPWRLPDQKPLVWLQRKGRHLH